MYITETTKDVKDLFSNLNETDDDYRMLFLLYLFMNFNNNLINDKNEANPDLLDDSEDIIIFNEKVIGYDGSQCEQFILKNIENYNKNSNTKKLSFIDGAVKGIAGTGKDAILLLQFEQLSFKEKIDVFSEIFIRCDNGTYFSSKYKSVPFDKYVNGYDLAILINLFKKEIK